MDDDEVLQIFGNFEFGGCGNVIFTVLQISGASAVKNPTRSATCPTFKYTIYNDLVVEIDPLEFLFDTLP